jgi:hypothetical protein
LQDSARVQEGGLSADSEPATQGVQESSGIRGLPKKKRRV